MLCSPPPATTLASSCAGSQGFCAPCCRRSSQRSRIHNRPKTGRTLLLHERLTGVAPPETALGRRRDLIDRRNTGLPCTVILDQAANVLKHEAEPAQEPDQGTLHDGTAVVDLLVSADLKRAPKQPDGDVAEQPAIFCFGAALPEFLRDRKP